MTHHNQGAQGEHLETKVTALLTRFDALQFEELKGLVFADGSFSYSRECELEVVLARLKQRGTIRAPGRWGPFQMASTAPGTLAGRIKLDFEIIGSEGRAPAPSKPPAVRHRAQPLSQGRR
jgi:hypothetical protein